MNNFIIKTLLVEIKFVIVKMAIKSSNNDITIIDIILDKIDILWNVIQVFSNFFL